MGWNILSSNAHACLRLKIQDSKHSRDQSWGFIWAPENTMVEHYQGNQKRINGSHRDKKDKYWHTGDWVVLNLNKRKLIVFYLRILKTNKNIKGSEPLESWIWTVIYGIGFHKDYVRIEKIYLVWPLNTKWLHKGKDISIAG